MACLALFVVCFLLFNKALAVQVAEGVFAEGVFAEEGEIKPYRVCVQRNQGATIVHYDGNSITLSPGSCISFEAKSVRIERRGASTTQQQAAANAGKRPIGNKIPPKFIDEKKASPQYSPPRLTTNPDGYSYVEPPYYNYSRATPPHYKYKKHTKRQHHKRRRR